MTHGVSVSVDHPINVAVVAAMEREHWGVPMRHGFMQVPPHLRPAVAALEAEGCDVIVGVVLYPVSTNQEAGKTFVELGVRNGTFKPPFFPIETRARIVVSKMMEAHPLLVDILESNLREISTNPAEEVGLIAIHGEFWPGPRYYNEGSTAEMARMLTARGLFSEVRHAPLNPKRRMLAVMREMIAHTGKRLLVTHAFTEVNVFTKRDIPNALKKLPEGSYCWNPRPMIPCPAMVDYCLFRAAEALRAYGMGDLVWPEAAAVWERYKDFHAEIALPFKVKGKPRSATT
ncbi:MAG: hypothetical protein NZ518_07900 [Dehalococcoidia bacterium]|nr:hypothetical protein [Dehalococcoidia bacterium]